MVNVLGFPAIGDFSPYLEEASFQRTDAAPLPKPQATTAEKLLHGTNDATLVQIDAQLAKASRTPPFQIGVAESWNWLFLPRL